MRTCINIYIQIRKMDTFFLTESKLDLIDSYDREGLPLQIRLYGRLLHSLNDLNM